MAFDQHIEADRIDDFNLFSAFVRVPLLILENVLGEKKSNEKDLLLESSCSSSKDHVVDCTGEENSSSSSSSGYHSQKKILSYTEMSNARQMEMTNSNSVLSNRTNNSSNLSSRQSHGSLSEMSSSSQLPGLKRTTKMSWSDESGLSLVEYSDESIRHEPVSPYKSVTSTTAPKPVKSALRRSRSIRNNEVEEDRTRYIPKMNKDKGSIIMPTRPYGGKDASGVESPQWGWYTTLTPPDMMYGANKSKKQDANAAQPTPQSPPVTRIPEVSEPRANHVFQTLQQNTAQVGWTSVPI